MEAVVVVVAGAVVVAVELLSTLMMVTLGCARFTTGLLSMALVFPRPPEVALKVPLTTEREKLVVLAVESGTMALILHWILSPLITPFTQVAFSVVEISVLLVLSTALRTSSAPLLLAQT